ncbi:Protein of unknown function [Gryllus bimaculatus]|nr:Protein of unknown function [Gryllus bimaculatus]
MLVRSKEDVRRINCMKMPTKRKKSYDLSKFPVQIEQLSEFKYLESLVRERKVASLADIHSRIRLAEAAFLSTNGVHGSMRKTRSRPESASFGHIFPILLFESKTWVTWA